MGLTWAELIARAFSRPTKEARREPPPRNPYGPSQGYQEGWEPYAQRPPPDWARQRQQEFWERAQQPNPGQRWAEKDGYRLWDIICAAELRWDSGDLLKWDKDFLTTFKNYGVSASATRAQWDQLIRIARKIGLQPSKV